MTAMRSRHDPVRLFLRRVLLFALVIFVGFGAEGVWGAWHKEKESAQLKQQSQAALAGLTSQQTQLQQNIDTLQSERGREAALRQQYAVGDSGENLVIIVNSTSTPPPPPEPSFLEKLKKAFTWW